jgi:hypothetical protein
VNMGASLEARISAAMMRKSIFDGRFVKMNL